MALARILARGATAPIRLGLSAGGLGLSVARTVVDEARHALGHDHDRRRSNGWSGVRPAPVRSPAPDVRGQGDALKSVVDVVVAPSPPSPPEAVAEDGVGAEIRVEPPWDGYDAMTAAQIRARLATAGRSAAAAVSLYEAAGRGRVSVVAAADRRLRSLDS
jgi:hypothetical protein